MANVNYAAEYSAALAQAYPYLSYFGDIWAANNSNRYKAGEGKTMYIPTVTTTGAHATNRNSIDGSFSRNWDNNWQAVTLEMDREWDTLADPMDIDETKMAASIANITRAFVELQKIPEMDAYLASKLAGFASAHGGVSTQSLTSSSILTEWDNGIEYMTNQRVNRDRVIAYMTPGAYKLLKQATGISRFLEVSNGIQRVDRNVASLDGIRIVEVPSDMMKTAYDFTTGWAVDEVTAQQINFILVDPEAVAAPVKYETSMVSAPTAQSKGKWLYYERYYYGAFMLDQRGAGVYVHLGAAPSLGTLTVTSVAGTATAGDTVITVSGKGIFGTGAPVEGLELQYSINNAAVTLTYNAVPDATKTWADLTNGATLEGQTAGKYITVALVNSETGKVVAGGNTTLVVKAE